MIALEALQYVEELLSVAETEGAARPEDYEALEVLINLLDERDKLRTNNTILLEWLRWVRANLIGSADNNYPNDVTIGGLSLDDVLKFEKPKSD